MGGRLSLISPATSPYRLPVLPVAPKEERSRHPGVHGGLAGTPAPAAAAGPEQLTHMRSRGRKKAINVYWYAAESWETRVN